MAVTYKQTLPSKEIRIEVVKSVQRVWMGMCLPRLLVIRLPKVHLNIRCTQGWRLLWTVNIMNETINASTSQMCTACLLQSFKHFYAASSPNRTHTHTLTQSSQTLKDFLFEVWIQRMLSLISHKKDTHIKYSRI